MHLLKFKKEKHTHKKQWKLSTKKNKIKMFHSYDVCEFVNLVNTLTKWHSNDATENWMEYITPKHSKLTENTHTQLNT